MNRAWGPRILKIATEPGGCIASGYLLSRATHPQVLFGHLTHMSEAELNHLFLKIDANCDGTLAWDEVRGPACASLACEPRLAHRH